MLYHSRQPATLVKPAKLSTTYICTYVCAKIFEFRLVFDVFETLYHMGCCLKILTKSSVLFTYLGSPTCCLMKMHDDVVCR